MRSKWQNALTRYQTPIMLVIYFVNYPLLYLVNVVLSRWLGAEDYGDYAAAFSGGTLLATIAIFGFDRACLQFLPMYRDQGEYRAGKGFIYFSATTIIVFGAVLSVAGYFVLDFLRIRFGVDEHPIVQAMILIVPMSSVWFLTKLMASQAKATSVALINQILFPIITVLLLAGLYSIRFGLTEVTVIGLMSVGYLSVLAVLLFMFRSIWRTAYVPYKAEFHRREWLYSSSALLITSLVLTGLQQSGTLLIEAIYPNEAAVGLFAAVKQVAIFPMSALVALNLLAVPELSVLIGQADYHAVNVRLGVYLRILIGIGLAALVVFALWGDSMLTLFDETFKTGHLALVVLGVGYVIAMAGGLTIPLLQMLKANRFIYTSMISLLVLNLALCLALIPTFGPTGAATAYTLSVLVIYGWQIYWLHQHAQIDYLASIVKRAKAGIASDGNNQLQTSAN